VNNEDSHDGWRALNEPPAIAHRTVEIADRVITLLRRILAKLEERSRERSPD
jgi:hypothetical protein